MAEDWVIPGSTHIYTHFGLPGLLGKGVTKEGKFNCSAFFFFKYIYLKSKIKHAFGWHQVIVSSIIITQLKR